MKGAINFTICLFILFVFAACSRQPVQEINAAKAAVDAAVADGAEQYSPAEARKVNDELAAALTEVSAQDDEYFGDYRKAKEMLARVKVDAEMLRAGLGPKKEEAKKQAFAAREAAEEAVKGAKASLMNTIRSKKAGSGPNVLTEDAARLDESLLEVKNLIDIEDYTTAVEKAGSVKADAAALIEKTRQITGEKPPKEDARPRGKHS